MNSLVPIHAPPPMNVSEIERVAVAIAKGGLFGSKDPNAVLTLCFLAYAEGQHPAVVFRDYHIIQGKPAKKADAMLRDFINAGGKVQWHTLNDECADATFTHPAGEARIEWTMERAKQAGIANPMWRKYPRQMLRSRVISEGVRTVYPGATSGLYEVGEVQEIVAENGNAEAARGHSEEGERTVSPTASDPQHQPEQGAAEHREYEFPEGPATGITQLKSMARSLWREIEGCGDEGELLGLIEMPENVDLLDQLSRLENPAHRTIWDGDGGDNPGISGLIERKRAEFAQLEPNILQAG